jgi:molybdopterin converting factor subunit 1
MYEYEYEELRKGLGATGMEITVRLFGAEADLAGQAQVTINVDRTATCGDLRRVLAERHPSLAVRLPACRFALNHEFAVDEHPVTEQDEVALIGLVSGG